LLSDVAMPSKSQLVVETMPKIIKIRFKIDRNYGSPLRQKDWLRPVLTGFLRSFFFPNCE